MKIRVCLFLFVLSLFISSIAKAEDDPAWLADKARLEKLSSENLSEEKECQVTWDILWNWAKKGNLEARADLFYYSFPAGLHAPQLYMPGLLDEISRNRHTIILGIHSLGVQLDNKLQPLYIEHSNKIFNRLLNYGLKGQGFLKCLTLYPREECAQLAQDRALVPKFDEYAAEIDALIAQGMKPKCFFRRGPDRQITTEKDVTNGQ